jgi:peptidyl-tRNA hydrolase
MRLRFGIGHPPVKNDTNAWVIKKPNPQEKKGLDESFKKTLSSLDQLLDKDWLIVMNDLHTK